MELIQTFLVENDGKGNFNNVTDKKAFKNAVGMITDAVWEDIDNDSKRFNISGEIGWHLIQKQWTKIGRI
jgi:hypothetical protein